MSNFQNLNLHPTIISALDKKGYSDPTPIQAQAIPHLLAKKDLLGIAQTGTGKTAAFSLPILDLLSQDKKQVKPNQIRALILTPTRELAVQISDNVALYGKGLGLKHAVIFGGVSESNQIKALREGLDIVVATPGRLLDLASQGHVRFSKVEIFVLDEADRMLDMGFINDVRKIIAKLPQDKQSLLFSATMPETIASLANSILKNPVKIEITPQSTTVERINQKVYLVDKNNKPDLLLDVLNKPEVVAALVFSKTKHGANKVVTYLEKYGVKVSAIHGNKSQMAREKALKSLREGKIKVLVATDIAARGIDVSSISHVINYDIPLDPESYVHRIGRTARAGREGVAISFCDYSENLHLRAVEKAIRMKIPVDNSHPFHGKAATNNSSDGRLLSRNNNKNNSERKSSERTNSENRNNERNSEKNNENRRFFGNANRSQNKSSSSRKSDSFNSRTNSFNKSRKPTRSRFNDGETSQETREPIAKKILRKFGFNKFAKDKDFQDKTERNDNFFVKEGTRNRNGNSNRSKNSNSQPFSKNRKKPFGRNNKSFR